MEASDKEFSCVSDVLSSPSLPASNHQEEIFMKRTFYVLAAALSLMLALSGCTGTRNNGTDADGQNGTVVTEDQNYTANENGTANETGDDGTLSTVPNSTAGTAGTDSTTVRNNDSTVADNVHNAVNEAGEVVDDVANGAADVVDDATDMVQDATGSTRNDTDRVVTSRSNG